MLQSLWKNSFFNSLNVEDINTPSKSIPRYKRNRNENKTLFINVQNSILLTDKKYKQSKNSATDVGINKWYIHTMDYYSPIQR
jgi:hypothetical protein